MKELHKYLKEINQHTEKITLAKFAGDMLEPTFGKYLGNFVNIMLYTCRPKSILELGLGSGYVTSILASYAKNMNGKLLSVDIAKEKIDRARNELSIYNDVMELIEYDIVDYLEESNDRYDLIVQDSNPYIYKKTLANIANLQTKGDVLLIHDANVYLNEYCPEDLKSVMEEFNEYLINFSLYQASLIDLEDGLWFCVRS